MCDDNEWPDKNKVDDSCNFPILGSLLLSLVDTVELVNPCIR